jgi:septal ring factor EnvC (AmiA/AmiB activator)
VPGKTSIAGNCHIASAKMQGRRDGAIRAVVVGVLCLGAGFTILCTPASTALSASKNSVTTLNGKKIKVDDARRLYEQHQRELEKAKKEQQEIAAETKELEAQRVALQSRLLKASKKNQGSEKRLIAIEAELDKLSAEETILRVALNKNRATIAQMLGVMQRMGREPPPIIVTQRHDALKMVRSAMLLSSFFPAFKTKAEKLTGQLEKLKAIETKTQEEKTKLANARVEFKSTKAEVDALLEKRRKHTKKSAKRLRSLRAVVSRHSKMVKDLGHLLKRLDAEVGKRSNLAAYELELKQSKAVQELKPDAKQVAFVQPGRLKPAIPFAKAKGLLRMPCQGRRLTDFGGKNETGSKSEGLRLETLEKASVVSPSDGWVIYAGQFRSYGQLLIINAGGGYHILLAGMDRIHASVGQFVLAGEPVAAMGKAKPLSESSKELRRPILYIEFRKGARPIDPNPWWSNGDVKKG